MSQDEITLYYSVASQSFTALWMLEELGIPYRLEERDIRSKANERPDYLAINPMGQVPTLKIGPVIVSENPAICIYLADRYSYGTLAPRIDDPSRGAYLKWMVFTTAVLDPVVFLNGAQISFPAERTGHWGGNWGTFDKVVKMMTDALERGPYLLGERFGAADVVLGAALSVRLFTKMLPAEPALMRYNERLAARPARRRAEAITWPPSQFAPS